MITFPPYPIEVLTNEKGEGYILYVRSNFIYTNDEFCIVLKETGELLHMTTKQFKIVNNFTYGINIKEETK